MRRCSGIDEVPDGAGALLVKVFDFWQYCTIAENGGKLSGEPFPPGECSMRGWPNRILKIR